MARPIRAGATAAALLTAGLLASGLLLGPAAAGEREAQQRPARSILEEIDDAVAAAAARVQPSVVQLLVQRAVVDPVGERAGEAETLHDTFVASGVVWDERGYIVSIGRIYEHCYAVTAILPGGAKRPADVVGFDEDTGVALVRIDPDGLDLQPATLGDSKRLRPGSIVIQVGNPFGLSGSVALGNVAAIDRVVTRGSEALTGVLQVTTPINPGDAGGALVDCRGDLVGVLASTYERGLDQELLVRVYEQLARLGGEMLRRPAAGPAGAAEEPEPPARPQPPGRGALLGGQGISFAIPTEQVAPVVERLVQKGRIERGWLGVQVIALDPVLKAQLDLPTERGVLVVGVVQGGPAARFGLSRHDILLTYDGHELGDLRAFKRMVEESPPGRSVALEILRAGDRQEVKITPAARPERR